MLIFTGGFLVACAIAQAEITLDGTLGPAGALPGPDFQIPASVGIQLGDNLFHSFTNFNIHTGESATFTGPPWVANILSRVTGGNLSVINGRLGSDITGANLYFLNPAGVVFGPEASLDMQGSFHVSTSDYISFVDGGRFSAHPSVGDSLLTVAPPSAYGFLGGNPSPISIYDSELSVRSTESFSIVGGDIEINGGKLSAPDGKLQIASAAVGEVIITETGLAMQNLAAAEETLISNSSLNVSGGGAGQVMIRSGQLSLDNESLIRADTLGDRSGLGIDIEVGQLDMSGGSIIDAVALAGSPTDGGIISVKADSVRIQGDSKIGTGTLNNGNAGNITIKTNRLELLNGAEIRWVHILSSTSKHLIL